MGKIETKAAAPVLEIDRKARGFFRPYRKSAPVQALAWFGQAGDQLQLRTLCVGVLALALLRRDSRLMRAGARMLVVHEAATLAKRGVKHRVDRWRPRNAGRDRPIRPRQGHSKAKALSSFPSGHSAGAMAVACAFAAEYPEYRGAALSAGAAISVAQVPTGAHYPSDVAAGMAIGAATAAIIRLVELWTGQVSGALAAPSPPERGHV